MKRITRLIILALIILANTGCVIQFKMNGASIDYSKIHSIAIADFPNNAALVYPQLSTSLSEGIREIYERQTRLTVNRKGGDLEIEGEITGYDLAQQAVTADSYASETKLTITIHVRYTNNVAPEESFDKTYSAYQTFDSNRLLTDVQEELCNTMIKELAENIYNDTVAKW